LSFDPQLETLMTPENTHPSKREVGEAAEQRALAFLQERGLRLIEANYYCRQGEVDLIMEEGEDLVFVEVRYRADTRFSHPFETIGPEKQRRIAAAARHYLAARAVEDRSIRFDTVAVIGPGERPAIEHVRDGFRPERRDPAVSGKIHRKKMRWR
jgi:putative endonuclease